MTIALPPGEWVGGMTKRFVPFDPPPLSETVTHPAAYDGRPLLFPGRPVCGCGCLLAKAGESCPACEYDRIDLDWCERSAVAASWSVTDYYLLEIEAVRRGDFE